MTDGSAWRQPDGVAGQGALGARSTSTTGTGQSPWWSDALSDPWRDPDAPSAVVIRPAAEPPPLEQDSTVLGDQRGRDDENRCREILQESLRLKGNLKTATREGPRSPNWQGWPGA